jgi:hypothetical protein
MEQKSLDSPGYGTLYKDENIRVEGRGTGKPKSISIQLKNGTEFEIFVEDEGIRVRAELGGVQSLFIKPESSHQIVIFGKV